MQTQNGHCLVKKWRDMKNDVLPLFSKPNFIVQFSELESLDH